MRKSVGFFGACAVAILVMSAVQAQTVSRFDLPAQPLAVSLRAVGSQTNTNVLFSPPLVAGLKAAPLSAEMTTDQAISALLTGSGIKFEFVNERTVVLSKVEARSGAAASSSGAQVSHDEAGRVTLAGVPYPSNGEGQGEDQKEASSSAASSEADTLKLEEVIVTAQKRQERLQDVPTSMEVLSAAKLEAQGVRQLGDFAKLVPGLRLIGGAGPGEGKVVLRGISTGTDRNALVGVYLDDIQFTPSSTRTPTADQVFDPSLIDIERIEVLKGPQSTLYGASTMGGLIKYVTKKPNLHNFETSMRVAGSKIDGGGGGYDARLSANFPIVSDKVAVRASAFYRDQPGYVQNTLGGKDDVNSSTVKGARMTLLASLGERVETTFTAYTQKIGTDNPYVIFLDSNTLRPSSAGLGFSSVFELPTKFEYDSLGNTTLFTLPFGKLSNSISYAEFRSESFEENTYLAPIFGMAAGSNVLTHTLAKAKRVSDEIRLTSNPGQLEWMLGAFYTDEDVVAPIDIRGTDSGGAVLPTTSPFFNIYTYRGAGTFEEKAVFGNLTYHFTDRLEATAGVRYSTNDQTFKLVGTGILAGPAGLNIGHPTKDSSTNYLATISYSPVNNLTWYVRAASAYRPGGPNALNAIQQAANRPRSFAADSIWNYELGLKGLALNGVLSYTAAAYHMDWTDIQVNVPFQGFSTTGNAAKAKSDGIEASLNWMPRNGWSIGFNGAYNDAKIAADAPGIFARKGNPLPYAPKLTLAAVIDYRQEISAGMTADAGLTFARIGAQNTGFQDGPTYKLESYETLDARIGINWSRYSLIARVDNITNEDVLTDIRVSNFLGRPLVGKMLMPRMFGISLAADF